MKKDQVIKLSNLNSLPTEVSKFLSKNAEFGINIEKYIISIKELKNANTLVTLSLGLEEISKVMKHFAGKMLNQLSGDLPKFVGKFEIEERFTKAEILGILKETEGATVEECSFDKQVKSLLTGEVSVETLNIDSLFPHLIVSIHSLSDYMELKYEN
jgi:hypothetical protein